MKGKILGMLKRYLENGGEVEQSTPALKAFGQNTQGLLPIITNTLEGIQDTFATHKMSRRHEGLETRLKTDEVSQFRMGGKLKEFNGPSHEQGGIPINENLMLDLVTPVAEVEGGETGYQLKDGGYVYSDKLQYGGMTFADKSRIIEDKYKDREDDITIKSRDMEMQTLADRNDVMKTMASIGQQLMMRYGGKIKKKEYQYGGPLPTDDTVLTTDNELNFVQPIPMISPIVSSGTDPVAPIPSMSGTGATATPRQLPGSPDVSNQITPGRREPFNYNKIALGLKGAALVKSFTDSLQPAETENLQLNPRADEAAGIAESLGINMAPVLEQINLNRNEGINRARQVAGSAVTQQVLAQSAIEKAGRAASSAELQEQQINNRLRLSEAQLKARLGSEERQERIRQQTAQSQNEATARGFGRDFYGNLSQIGSEFNKYQYTQDAAANAKNLAALSTAEGVAILSKKYPDFTITPEVVDEIKAKVQAGEPVDINQIIKFRAAKKNK